MPENDQQEIPRAPMTEEELKAATVGEVKQLNGKIVLAEPDPEWPGRFEAEAARIRSALGPVVCQLEHVGSTSVPGLPAKPIIDMLLIVPDSSDEAAYVPPLEAIGYQLAIREPDWYEHRLLRLPDPGLPVNLHVFSPGCLEIDRMVGLRDWLRANEADRDLYATTKRQLAALDWKYVQNYADAKTEVIEGILRRTP